MRQPPAPLLAAAAVAAAALAACGQPFLSARIEVPEFRMTEPPVTFPASPVAPQAVCTIVRVPSCSAQTLSFDLGDALDQKGVTSDVHLTGLALHLAGGDGRGIRHLEVDLMDPQTGATTMLARYDRPSGAAALTDVVAQASNTNVSPFLQAGVLETRVEVVIDPTFLPTGFTASVEAAFSVDATLDYRKL